MDVAVFESRKLEEANRASAMLRDANVTHRRTRRVGDVEVEMTPDATDVVTVSWLIRVPREELDAAKNVLGAFIAETGARPRATWVGPLYLIALVALTIAIAVRGCAS